MLQQSLPSPEDELYLLGALSQQLKHHGALDPVLGPMLRLLSSHTGLLRASLVRVHPEIDRPFVEAAHGYTPSEIRSLHEIIPQSIIQEVLRTGQTIAVPSIQLDSRFSNETHQFPGVQHMSFLCVPISNSQGMLGGISAYRLGTHGSRQQRDIRLLEIIASMLQPFLGGQVHDSPITPPTASPVSHVTSSKEEHTHFRKQSLKELLSAVEKEHIISALKSTHGNMAKAARQLELSDRIMGLRVQKYAIDSSRYKSE